MNMLDVFSFSEKLIEDYSSFSRSFTTIRSQDIFNAVESEYNNGRYWPEPLIQINPNYKRSNTVQELVQQGLLHPECAQIFLAGKNEGKPTPLTLYKHQVDALALAHKNKSYIVTTGTGSGKSMTFFLPIIDRILKAKSKDPTPKTRAIVIYPMNALANSQLEELNKFLHGYAEDGKPFTVKRYTGQEKQAERENIATNPPDILLTNFMMLELILTRYESIDRRVVEHCQGLEFLVLDELHTYRGRQGADVAMLVRRLRERLNAQNMICIGTSATMSSTGTASDQKLTVAEVSSKLFGQTIQSHQVVDEDLERLTDDALTIDAIRSELGKVIRANHFQWNSYQDFCRDPLAVWVELTLGISMIGLEKLSRARPLTLKKAVEKLSQDAKVTQEEAQEALKNFLLASNQVRTPQDKQPFAFKLHQFISGPGKVYVTLEPVNQRLVTLDGQRFAPGRQKEGVLLYSAHFCRDCGQEYHPVWHESGPLNLFAPREIDDVTSEEEDVSFGFLALKDAGMQYHGEIDLPESWMDFSKSDPRIKSANRKWVPQTMYVQPNGEIGRGEEFWYIPGKFRFCLNCLFLHEAHGKDVNRLSSLSGEGRSSATTMLTLSLLRQLFGSDWPEDMPDPRKLLGFSDNRQDAALQAGHFNDFIHLLTLRSGLIHALQKNGGLLQEENLADEVFRALGFHGQDTGVLSEYLQTPKLMGLARQEAQRSLRFVLGYRLLRDLRKGWRYNNPNLDQLGLLQIDYLSLNEFAQEESLFSESHRVLQRLSPKSRIQLACLVFDELRRNLCLESRYLDSVEQDRARNTAYSYLNERWAFATDEKLATSRYLVLGSKPDKQGRVRLDLVSGGPRSRLVRLLKFADFWKETDFADQVRNWRGQELTEIVQALLEAASNYGYVQKQIIDAQTEAWRLKSSAMQWKLKEAEESNPNPFFRQLYLSTAALLDSESHPLFAFEAHEHTAQVEANKRQMLESRFRYTQQDKDNWAVLSASETPLRRLPIMYCSPTMELGVDISSLNTVYLRNVPPTPANYAQRSGRAGRSGQAALVVTYCAAMSPHDQWFFQHKNDMVYGVVKAPTLDLSNRDLIDSHLHAIWLSQVECPLNSSIAGLLDLEKPDKPVKAELHSYFEEAQTSEQALEQAQQVLLKLSQELTPEKAPWFHAEYASQSLQNAPIAFDAALGRWRKLLEATLQQMEMADTVVRSHATSPDERENARLRYNDAANQRNSLEKSSGAQNSDFYTYRYLASQGFLPGYNFPRLPLMAWIPARGGSNGKTKEGNMVSRSRFLALSEFGPRSLIYHEGRTFRVVRAKLNLSSGDQVSPGGALATLGARICSACGYGHLGVESEPEPTANVCEHCQTPLTDSDRVNHLYRIETVETVQVERISINDEERQRQGYELQTTYRFLPGPDGRIQLQQSHVCWQDEILAELSYAPAAQIWRINRGWRRRKDKRQLGFFINPITGSWSKQDNPDDADQSESAEDKALRRVPNQRIVPFVEDFRNVLILSPEQELTESAMATLQAALKRGIEQTFQIEDGELACEPLPNTDHRRRFLFYEAAEGGAGVLTRLANEPEQLAAVASQALKLMHFAAPEGAWVFEHLAQQELKTPTGEKLCEAGCYLCLLSYYNQPDHVLINRQDEEVLKVLVALANANVRPIMSPLAQEEPKDSLQAWIQALEQNQLKQPDMLNVSLMQGQAQADAQYKSARALVFLTEPTKDVLDYAADRGYQVVIFGSEAQWPEVFAQYQAIFGISV